MAENNTNLPHEQFIDERDTNRGDNDSTIQSGFGKIGTRSRERSEYKDTLPDTRPDQSMIRPKSNAVAVYIALYAKEW